MLLLCISNSGCNKHNDNTGDGGDTIVVKKEFNVGDIITFGRYEQDNDTLTEPEPIEWRVISKDADGHILVISEKILTTLQFNNSNHGALDNATWHNSTIRTWLNGYDGSYNTMNVRYSDSFIDVAFTDAERAKIIPKELDVDTKKTTDKVFLLNNDEVAQYFPDPIARLAEPTRYALRRGLYVYGAESGVTSVGTCNEIRCYSTWWLRTDYIKINNPNYPKGLYTASFIRPNVPEIGQPKPPTAGGYSDTIKIKKLGVRPAMWLE